MYDPHTQRDIYWALAIMALTIAGTLFVIWLLPS